MSAASEEPRARIRASAMWLLVAALTLGVGLLLYTLLIGFDRERDVPIEAVSVSGHDLVVRYIGGSNGCGDPDRIDVAESADDVVLTAYVLVRRATRLSASCDDEGIPLVTTVRLAGPLGERTIRDGSRDGAVIPVVDDPAELVAGTG